MSDRPQVPTRELISPALFERFAERIVEDLTERPLALPADEHRLELARRLETAGDATAYQILGLAAGATTDEVTRAFTEAARLVHPEHAPALGVPEDLLRLLFEHTTRAYLVLSDPERRRAYDREHQQSLGPPPRSEDELAQVRREMAHSSLTRARVAMRNEQYHTVVELLRDAVRWDKDPEAYALLADAQARNPRWREQAIDSLREAIRLAPREVAYQLKLARLLEEEGRLSEARSELEGVLARFPNHPDALTALERLRTA